MSEYREKCYECNRPKSCCLCEYINKIETNTQFVILMHPKEFKKTKNNTGKMTSISLPNSQIHVGIDFSHNEKINAIINNPNNTCYVLYPSESSIKLNDTNIKKENKNLVIFIIDSTWPCSIKILRQSSNIQNLPYISFEHTKISQYKFKTQPKDLALSTIESTLCVLELLNKHQIENIKENDLSSFLEPFTQ
ncbi:MAG: DTW domain-containing protein, partial [Campylobacteraceae bacterium]|nr:DTW domain-containing protein [Campylobacteraceae bacterium]